MTIEEINEIVKNAETLIGEIKTILSDVTVCSSDRSKTILLAAAERLATSFKTTTTRG